MRKLVTILSFILFINTLVACSSNVVKTDKDELETSVVENDEKAQDVDAKSMLGNEKQIALDYFEVFLNNENEIEKSEFVKNFVHEDFHDVLNYSISLEVSEEVKFFEPTVISSIDYENELVSNGKLVLLDGVDNTGVNIEAIILFNQGKLYYIYQSRDRADIVSTFIHLRELFN